MERNAEVLHKGTFFLNEQVFWGMHWAFYGITTRGEAEIRAVVSGLCALQANV